MLFETWGRRISSNTILVGGRLHGFTVKMEVLKCVYKYMLLVSVIEVVDVVVGWWRYGNVGIFVGDQFTCKWICSLTC